MYSPQGERVCKTCLCGGCGVHVSSKSARVCVVGVRYCSSCACAECRIPLKESVQVSGIYIYIYCFWNKTSEGFPYRKSWLSRLKTKCHFQLQRGNSKDGQTVCAACVCDGCKSSLKRKDAAFHIRHQGSQYCTACACVMCKTPLKDDKVWGGVLDEDEANDF